MYCNKSQFAPDVRDVGVIKFGRKFLGVFTPKRPLSRTMSYTFVNKFKGNERLVKIVMPTILQPVSQSALSPVSFLQY